MQSGVRDINKLTVDSTLILGMKVCVPSDPPPDNSPTRIQRIYPVG
jgi:hypothetical protein